MEKQYSPTNSSCMSEDVRALCAAMIAAKALFKKTGLSGENTHQKYKYAKLADIYNAIEDALGKNNVNIWHFAYVKDGVEYIESRLIHAPTGQWVADTRLLHSEKPGNQGKAAANTTMRKCAVLSLCGIAPEDDDSVEEELYLANQPYITTEEKDFLQESIKTAPNKVVLYNAILKEYRIKDLAELKQNQLSAVIKYIFQNTQK